MLCDGFEYRQVDHTFCSKRFADTFKLCLCVIGVDELSRALTHKVGAFDELGKFIRCGRWSRRKAVDAQFADGGKAPALVPCGRCRKDVELSLTLIAKGGEPFRFVGRKRVSWSFQSGIHSIFKSVCAQFVLNRGLPDRTFHLHIDESFELNRVLHREGFH